jgi:hypothetical protein
MFEAWHTVHQWREAVTARAFALALELKGKLTHNFVGRFMH